MAVLAECVGEKAACLQTLVPAKWMLHPAVRSGEGAAPALRRGGGGRQVPLERVVKRREPRRLVWRRHRAREDRTVRRVAKGHDIVVLILLPLEEALLLTERRY